MSEHLDDIDVSCGCIEIAEKLSEKRADEEEGE